MLTTQSAIFRLRRDLTIGFVLRVALVLAGVLSFLVVPAIAPQIHGSIPLIVVVAIWVALGYGAAKSSRLAADAPNLIAAGRLEEADQQLDTAIRAFSAFPGPKLQTLAQLAELRHAQERYRECADLCQAILSHSRSESLPAAVQLRFLLADSMLELNDLNGAHAALSVVAVQPLGLSDVLRLLFLQLSYEARIGAWTRMMHDLMVKVRLAELMPSPPAAAVQGLLALAAGEVGRDDCRQWLRARAELLVPADKIVEAEPLLAPLWPTVAMTEPKAIVADGGIA